MVHEIGARGTEAILLNDMGVVAYDLGDYAGAQRYYRAAGALSTELGDRVGVLYAAINLAHAAVTLQDDREARLRYLEALALARELQVLPLLLESVAGLAGIHARAGQVDRALELLGLVVGHPALHDDARITIEQALEVPRARYSEQEIEAGLARGRNGRLDVVVAALLSQG